MLIEMGHSTGSNFEHYERCAELTELAKVIASGGIAEQSDLVKLQEKLELLGTIVGKAYYRMYH